MNQPEVGTRRRREPLNERIDVLVTPTIREALERLAERNLSSLGQEARTAILERLEREAAA